jgi:hypothetical protein
VTVLARGADVGFHRGYEMPKFRYDKVCINAETFDDGSWEGVLRHELAHVASYNLSEALVPTWVTEGISIMIGGQLQPKSAGDWRSPRELETLFRRTSSPLRGELSGRWEAYQQSGHLIAFLTREFGAEKLHDLLRACAKQSIWGYIRRSLAIGSRMDEPIRKVYHMTERQLFELAK